MLFKFTTNLSMKTEFLNKWKPLADCKCRYFLWLFFMLTYFLSDFQWKSEQYHAVWMFCISGGDQKKK